MMRNRLRSKLRSWSSVLAYQNANELTDKLGFFEPDREVGEGDHVATMLEADQESPRSWLINDQVRLPCLAALRRHAH